jgi:hypothetical protein
VVLIDGYLQNKQHLLYIINEYILYDCINGNVVNNATDGCILPTLFFWKRIGP